jgi:dienelactone hydrolase
VVPPKLSRPLPRPCALFALCLFALCIVDTELGIRLAPARASSAQAVRSFSLSGLFYETVAGGVCKAGKTHAALGFEPAAPGRYPLFVYLTGTTMRYDGPEARKISEEMARRGFVAVSLEYENRVYAYCNSMRAKAQCLFGKSGTDSALSKLCTRSNVDCDRGIVVSGFSQGANLAALSRNYEPRVVGALLLGHGHRAARAMDSTACQAAAATALELGQTRAINGEADAFFGDTLDGVRKQLEVVSGRSCPGAADCLQSDGSGWYIVRGPQLKDGSADHCYFFDTADGYCAKFKGLDANWVAGNEPWSLAPNLDWLASRVSRAAL